ncbi:MAG: hypothetical protein HUU29_08655, partial [Planctomycetaceae bacterium]|nr:hypothetical protein [Planctomycetaceae bacterium]
MAFMDYVKLYREKGTEAWGKLPTRQRWIYGGIGAMILVGFVLLIASFGSGEGGMVPLKVPVTDTRTALDRLAMFQIQAELSEDQNNILVPREKEKNAVWVLASAKILPDAKSHYQFLRETDLTQTDARMQEAVRTTVEELMSETIAAMSFISQAEVRIAPPDKRWHVGHMIESAQAKASVIVGLRDQSVLDDAQVAAIVQTVAFSYPTMPEENVVITDLNGNPYRYDGDWTVTANYNKTKVREEVMIAMKAEGALRSFGPRAEATVFIDQATKNEKTTEFLDQEGRPTVRQSREESETEMKRTGPVGAIGEVGPSARETPGMGEFEVKRELAETREDGLLYGTRETVRTEHGKLQIDYSQSAVTVTLNEEHKAKIEPEMLRKSAQFVLQGTVNLADETAVNLLVERRQEKYDALQLRVANLNPQVKDSSWSVVDLKADSTEALRAQVLQQVRDLMKAPPPAQEPTSFSRRGGGRPESGSQRVARSITRGLAR